MSVTRNTTCSAGAAPVALPMPSLAVRKIASTVRAESGLDGLPRLMLGRGLDLEVVGGGGIRQRRAGLDLVEQLGRLGTQARRRPRRSRQRASTCSLTSSSVRSRAGVMPETSYQT